MSLHRIGNDTYLNEKEYQEHNDATWAILLFISGAIAAGYAIYFMFVYFELLDLPKWFRFTCIISSAIFTGGLVAKFREAILLMIALLAITAILGGLGYLIWIII